jgi:hypothetical protein
MLLAWLSKRSPGERALASGIAALCLFSAAIAQKDFFVFFFPAVLCFAEMCLALADGLFPETIDSVHVQALPASASTIAASQRLEPSRLGHPPCISDAAHLPPGCKEDRRSALHGSADFESLAVQADPSKVAPDPDCVANLSLGPLLC